MIQALAEALRSQISQLPRPTPVSTLKSLIRKSGLRISDAELKAGLHELASHGQAFVHPPSRQAQNASSCYFNKTPLQYVTEALLEALQSKPIWTEAALRKKVPKAYRELFDDAIGNLLREGRLFESRRRKSNLLTAEPPRTIAQVKHAIMERAVAAKAPVPLKEMKAQVSAEDRELFDDALRQLLGEKQLFERKSGGIRTYVTETPRPSEFLSHTQKNTLRRILTSINQHRITPVELNAVLAFFDGAGAEPVPPTDQKLSEDMLIRWYGEDLPRHEGLRTIPIPWTWRRYEQWCEENNVHPNNELFHQLLGGMASRSQIAFTVHNRPADLTSAEKSILRKNRDGFLKYYWTLLP